MLLSLALIFAGCSSDSPLNEEKPLGITFQPNVAADCNEVIFNPDMGFYSALTIEVTPSGIEDLQEHLTSIAKTSKPLTAEEFPKTGQDKLTYDLVHLKFDISAYSKNANGKDDIADLGSKAEADVNTVLTAIRSAGKTAVVRFAYDKGYDGNEYKEPESFEVILGHVSQISAIYKNYPDVITGIECGMIGPWGEMHTSNYAVSVKENNKWKPDYYLVQVMHKYLEGLDGVEIPFLVRQPKFIYAYLNTYCGVDYSFSLDDKNEAYPKAIPSYIPEPGTDEYKIGLYNDGYLGSKTDSGTYKGPVRADEISFMTAFTDHTPYGGELIGDYGLVSGSTVSVENFENVHLSFLNIGWNADVLYGFNSVNYDNTSLFQYLYKHMGYRYLVESSDFEETGKAKVSFKLSFRNSGFANLPYHRSKAVQIIARTSGKDEVLPVTAEAFTGQESMTVTADISSLEAGEYSLYLKLSDADGRYVIRPANMGWDDKLKAVSIGGFTIPSSEE